MNVVRPVALFISVLALTIMRHASGAVAQDSGFGCDDFLTQAAAQNYLEKNPSDPYGFDPDGNGIACEHMLANGDTDAESATEQPEASVATVVATERPVPTPTPTPAPGSSQSNPAPVGTTLATQGLAVTVDTAYFDYGFANAIPRGGYKLMILGVTIKNVSDDGNRGYNAARFSGIDAVTGNNYNPVTVENVGVLLTNGDLQPGEYVSGTALIEVQETATNVIVKYDADILGDEDLYWS